MESNIEDKSRSLRIAEMSDDDKPREKALKLGVNQLTNAELMAIILGSGLSGKSVIDLSRDILSAFDNKLSALSRTTIHQLTTQHKGIGPAKAISLLAAVELGSRCVEALVLDDKEPVVRSSRTIFEYMKQSLERLPHEEFWVLYLNNANRIISKVCLSRGGLDRTLVDVKLLFKGAIDRLATSVIMVHNHPSGTLKPSMADDKLTKNIQEAAKLLEIRVLDHIIVTPDGYYSYADEGRL